MDMNETAAFLAALPDECSREFEVELTSYVSAHLSDETESTLYSILNLCDGDVAYRAFYALTIAHRLRKDYRKLKLLVDGYPGFKKHNSYNHVLLVYWTDAEILSDYERALAIAASDAERFDDNAGYTHMFASLFAYLCEHMTGSAREEMIEKWYERALKAVNDSIDLDPDYARYYCTKGRILAADGRYLEAYTHINTAISTENSSRGDYALRILGYRHQQTVIMLEEQRSEMEKELRMLRLELGLQEKPEESRASLAGLHAYVGAEPYIFVSYSHNDTGRVIPILKRLEADGIRFWYDEGIESASRWRDAIAKKVEGSEAVLFFSSAGANESFHVQNEMYYAQDCGKRIIGVKIDQSELTGGLRMYFSQLQFVACTGAPDEYFYSRLESAIRRPGGQENA